MMDIHRFIEVHVMTDPEWRRAYEDADATREAARALVRARREAGLTQAALAQKVGTGQAVISRIESGAMSPTMDMVSRLAAGLGMRPIIALEPIRVARHVTGRHEPAPGGMRRRASAR